MASGTIPNPNQIALYSDGLFRKQGRIVNYHVRSWQTASNVTIPVGYRPIEEQYFVAEQRQGGGSTGTPGRIRFNTDGSVALEGTNDQFIGTFTWICSA